MPHEIEVKILDINVVDIIKKLEKIGAKKIAEKNFKRIVFSKPNSIKPLIKWIRLRTDGKKTTIAYKCRKDNSMKTEEIEIEISDFETGKKILQKTGLVQNIYEENKRIEYQYQGITFDLDFWPKLKPYLEIEAETEEQVKQGVKLLGFSMKQTTTKTTQEIYKENGIDINKIKELI